MSGADAFYFALGIAAGAALFWDRCASRCEHERA